jgi:hypothetical protein
MIYLSPFYPIVKPIFNTPENVRHSFYKQEPRRRCYTIHGGDLMSDHINYGSDEQSKHAKQTYVPYYLPEQLAALSEKFLFFTFHT